MGKYKKNEEKAEKNICIYNLTSPADISITQKIEERIQWRTK